MVTTTKIVTRELEKLKSIFQNQGKHKPQKIPISKPAINDGIWNEVKLIFTNKLMTPIKTKILECSISFILWLAKLDDFTTLPCTYNMFIAS